MHSFEIEKTGDEKNGDSLLDIKILPNRAHDCLSHRGIAGEVAVLFDLKMKGERFEKFGNDSGEAKIAVNVEDSKLCPRYVGRLVENVWVKESPAWLKERLESVGQRSINNIVDITNYVMLDTGQPMHAFDADKVRGGISVRKAKVGERIETLDGKDVELDESILVIADDEGPLAIAGVKGGKRAEVDAGTRRVILEAANFNPGNVRKTSQKINIKTDASKRFENEITPELAGEGMEYATALIVQEVGRDAVVHAPADEYPRKRQPYKLGVSLSEINRLLGTPISEETVAAILDRFGWEWEVVEPREYILELAPQCVGAPYKLGASVSIDAPREFDCSSFTAFVYSQAGISIPRMSIDQYVYGEPVDDPKDLKPGDLLFSNSGNGKVHFESIEWMKGAEVPGGIDHVGIFLGDDKVIHASRNGESSVQIERASESKFFKEFIGARRISGLDEKRFVVTVPAARLDLRLKEDLIEEIGRVYGYEKIAARLPESRGEAKVNKAFYYAQTIRNILTGLGFDEVIDYAFRNEGEVEVENPLASDKKFLRSDLSSGLGEALEFNARYADLLGLDEIRIFEIGNVFAGDTEDLRLSIGVKNVKKDKKKEDEKAGEALIKLFEKLGCAPESETEMKNGIAEISLSKLVGQLPEVKEYGDILATHKKNIRYKSLSPYPFVLRDIAVWMPAETPAHELEAVLLEMGGPLLAAHRLFDTFTKEFDTGEKKTSYAFRLVFQSMEKTLSDDEVNGIMSRVNDKVMSKGWEVR
ncbi:MAG TPA: phenylalanine--tRNA ligase beta subunit-related protein [Candidatus Paceibacterota bacterium]|nr:phenylalanine--tRNA ligase beta subunit-related protein [Candidatus Paceibacterota bacterium]